MFKFINYIRDTRRSPVSSFYVHDRYREITVHTYNLHTDLEKKCMQL